MLLENGEVFAAGDNRHGQLCIGHKKDGISTGARSDHRQPKAGEVHLMVAGAPFEFIELPTI